MFARIYWLKLVFISVCTLLFYFWYGAVDKPPRHLHSIITDYKVEDEYLRPMKYDVNLSEIIISLSSAEAERRDFRPQSEIEDLSTCVPRKNIAFIKTHKTAGTVVQNILFRYGIEKNLLFALPPNSHDFYYPRFFTKRIVARHGYFRYNVICHHMRFDYDEVAKTMPDGAAFVTILREPGMQFESFFDFFWPIVLPFQKVPYGEVDSKENWLDNAAEYVQDIHEWRGEEFWEYVHLSKNPSTFDLGFDNMNEKSTYLSSTITKLDQAFDLVMIADYFLESLVLFADLMCWDLKHVSSIPLNIRNRDGDEISKEGHARIREKARRWNKADTAMYDFFNATFWKRVKKYGYKRMARDVQKLRKINADLMSMCIEGGTAVDYSLIRNREYRDSVFKPHRVKVKGYNLKEGAESINSCKDLIQSETAYSQKIYHKQRLRKLKPFY